MRAPNIILIVADDLGYGDLGACGNPAIATPSLDRLAAEGTLLRQHYSASPMCAPARASLLTGRYNHRTGAVDVPSNRGLDRLALRERTLPELLAAAGYATGMVGKWHNGLHDPRYHPNQRGFGEFVGFLNGGMDYWRWTLDANGAARPADGSYLTDAFTWEATAFIERHRQEPFFLYLAYNAPHSPFQAPDELVDRYRQRGDLSDTVCRIYAMIERMDEGIGRILKTVDAAGLAGHTAVVFTSDNGPYMGGSGQNSAARFNGDFSGSKGDVLEGGIRVPAVARWPGHWPAGQRCDELVHFTDWLPTFLSLAGGDAPLNLLLDGRSLSGLLAGRPHDLPVQRFWQWNRYEPVSHCNAAMRDGDWKLLWPSVSEACAKEPADNEPYERGLASAHWLMDICADLPARDLPPAPEPRLFDLSTDPCEQNDLAARYPERLASMERQWDAWFDEVMAEWRQSRASNVRPAPVRHL